MKIKNIIAAIILILFGIFSFYLSGVTGLLNFILSISIYSLVFYGLYYLWKSALKKQKLNFTGYLEIFLYKISIFLIIISTIIGSFSYYYNEISPAYMPEYTISNGEKTVIFQSMSHIGTSKFYNEIKSNLIKAKKDDYVYFYEQVKPGKEESYKQFNEAIGIEFDPKLYENFSKLYGVINQDNSLFLENVNNLDFNVDLSIDEIMEIYNKKEKPDTPKSPPIKASRDILDLLSNMNGKELKLLIYINRSILSFIMNSEKTTDIISNNFTNQDIFEIILEKRNEILAEEIINSEYDKIYLTYGLMHFKGTLELLKQNDSNWKTISEKKLYPLED